jgi:phytol kinase
VKFKVLERLGLSGVSVRGDALGLMFYALVYTILAGVFFDSSYVIAAGIIPMSFGDGSAALIGTRFGTERFRLPFGRTLQGSLGFFTVTFIVMGAFLSLLSILGIQTLNHWLILCLVVAGTGTVVEALSPRGVDNLAVPIICVLAMKAIGEW